MCYSLGMALWISYKPRETAQALGEFNAAIKFFKQREPTHHSLIAFEKAHDLAQKSLTLFQEPGTRTAWPYWRSPTFRRDDRREMTDLFAELWAMAGRGREATKTASTMQQGLQRRGLHEFTSPTPDPSDLSTFTEIACDKIERMKQQKHKADTRSEAICPLQPTQATEPQSFPPSAGDDTMKPTNGPPPRQGRGVQNLPRCLGGGRWGGRRRGTDRWTAQMNLQGAPTRAGSYAC